MTRALSSTRIDVLTDEQASSLGEYRSRWQAVRRCTEPVDRPTAEEAIRLAYKAAGLERPKSIIWCGGPVEMVQDWERARRNHPIGVSVRGLLLDNLLEQTDRAITQCFSPRVITEVRNGIIPIHFDVVSAAVKKAIADGADKPWPGVWATLWRTISSPVELILSSRSRQIFNRCSFSQEELGCLAAYEYLHDVAGLHRETEVLRPLLQVGTTVGWVLPHENVCWLSERHNLVAFDARGRLHCATGPALAYPDGWSLYAWKGVEIPAEIIDNPDTITLSRIDREPDIFVRRCMIEIITPERFVAMGGADRVAQDEFGVLWRKSWMGLDFWTAVEVVNGTAEADGSQRHYFLQVPTEMRTPRAAVAWTYGLSEQRYADLTLRT